MMNRLAGGRRGTARASGAIARGRALLCGLLIAVLPGCRPFPAPSIEPRASASDAESIGILQTTPGEGHQPNGGRRLAEARSGRDSSRPLLLDASPAAPPARDWWKRYGPVLVPIVVVGFAIVMFVGI